MDVGHSLESTDGRESCLAFKKPASEVSRRNYRRHSPTPSRSPSTSPGGRKHDRSPSSPNHEDGGSKRGKHADIEIEKARDDRSKRGIDTGARGHRIHNRDYYGRHEEHERNYNRRYASYHDRNYYTSCPEYHHYDDGRYLRQSPERFARDRGTEEGAHRRKESRTIERERYRDDRSIARASERENKREDQDRKKMKDRDFGRVKSGQKQRHDSSDVDAERFRHDKSNRDVEDLDGKERHKSKLEIDKLKGNERKSDRGERKKVLDEDECHRGQGKASDEKYRVKSAPNLVNDYPSDGSEGIERSDWQDSSKKKEKDKKFSDDWQKGSNTLSDLQQDVGDANEIDIPRAALTESNSLEVSKKLDEKAKKGSKWGQEGESSDLAADAEAAKVAAMRAAALVNINLGGFKSLDEKRKMLWGGKDQKPAAACGTNIWDKVQFSDRERLEKFHKLMGVKGDTSVPVAGGSGDQASGLFTSQKQEELQQDLEKQFTAGLRRRDGRTVGLGL